MQAEVASAPECRVDDRTKKTPKQRSRSRRQSTHSETVQRAAPSGETASRRERREGKQRQGDWAAGSEDMTSSGGKPRKSIPMNGPRSEAVAESVMARGHAATGQTSRHQRAGKPEVGVV